MFDGQVHRWETFLPIEFFFVGPLLNLPLIGQIPFPFSGLDLVLDFGLGLGLVNLVGNKTLFIELTIHVLHKQSVDTSLTSSSLEVPSAPES